MNTNKKYSKSSFIVLFMVMTMAVSAIHAQTWYLLDQQHSINLGSDIVIGSTGTSTTKYFAAKQDVAMRIKTGEPGWTKFSAVPTPDFVACASDEPAVVYAGIRNNALRKSLDYGDTWITISADLASNLQMTRMGISPSNHSFLYVGCDEFINGGTNEPVLFYSTNGGTQWFPDNNFPTLNVNVTRIIIDTSDNRYVAATGSDGGVRKYNSGSLLWDKKNSGMGTDINVTALDFNKQNSAILYAGTINPSGSSHVYKSTDYGETWAISAGHDGRAVTDIKVNPISTFSAHVYVATNNGLWRSTDSGSNWSIVASTSLGFSDVDFRAIAINPINGGLFAVTTTQIWYSFDDATTWYNIGPDAVAGRALFAYGNPVNNVDVYLMNGKPNSILLSKIPDHQFLWQTVTKQLNGSANISARDLIIHPQIISIFFAAGRGNNTAQIFRKTGVNGSFYAVYSGSTNASGNFNAVRFDPSDVHHMLAVADHDANLSEIAYSTSDGNSNTWSPPPGPPTKGDYFDLAFDKNSGSPSTIAYAVGGDDWSSGSLSPALLFSKSSDGGLHWTTTTPIITSNRLRYRSIALDPINTAVLYCGYDAVLSSVSGGIHKSTNGGQTWTTLTMPLTGSMHHVVSLLHHPTKSNVLYLAEEADPGVWSISATYDGGSTWNQFRAGVESYIPILRLAFKSILSRLSVPNLSFIQRMRMFTTMLVFTART